MTVHTPHPVLYISCETPPIFLYRLAPRCSSSDDGTITGDYSFYSNFSCLPHNIPVHHVHGYHFLPTCFAASSMGGVQYYCIKCKHHHTFSKLIHSSAFRRVFFTSVSLLESDTLWVYTSSHSISDLNVTFSVFTLTPSF